MTNDSAATLPRLSLGPLPREKQFRLALIVFSSESRHWFGGIPYPLEAEVYFFDDKEFGSFEAALTKPGATVALSLLFKQALGDYGLDIFLGHNQDELRFYSQSLLPDSMSAYYFYNGSFIESRCQEPVTWIVNKRIRSVSMDHIAWLKSRMTGDDSSEFYASRSLVQPLDGRTIYGSKGVLPKPTRLMGTGTDP